MFKEMNGDSRLNKITCFFRRLRNTRCYLREFLPEWGEKGLWAPFGPKYAEQMREDGCIIFNLYAFYLVMYPPEARIEEEETHANKDGYYGVQKVSLPNNKKKWEVKWEHRFFQWKNWW